MSIEWLEAPVPAPDEAAGEQARARQEHLTKPLGSLGRLEDVAVTLAALGNGETLAIEPVWITVFAADHGVTAAPISAYPREVTVQMLHNFAGGGAAVNVLARLLEAQLEVIDLGTAEDPGPITGVRSQRAGNGTADLRFKDAMAFEQMAFALNAGRQAAGRAADAGARLFIGGGMGIGNSTSASALAAALLDADATTVSGPGTGLDPAGVRHKAEVIDQAMRRYRGQGPAAPLTALQALGGFEIAALVGAYITCAQRGIPVLVDGFITCAAALTAVAIKPDIAPWLLYSHRSAEPGHRLILDALGAEPLLDLGMRLGEGSGAAATVPILRLAVALHNRMASFDEVGVSRGDD